MRKSRGGGGCSALLGILFLGCLGTAIFLWPTFVDINGAHTGAAISEKRETVRIHYGDWYRRFQILAAYRIPGQPVERHAICDVDQKTYDSLHVDNQVTVHYLPSLLDQPFISATHISPCTSLASVNLNPSIIPKLVIALVSLLAILFTGAILRARRLRAVLLFLWFFLVVAYFVTPRTEPTPSEPRSAQATVQTIDTITSIPDSSRHSITLSHPFQIVRLQFTPPGMDSPVTAIDKIDLNSIPNLQAGQTVDISYDAANPRIAALRGGTRLFPQHFALLLLLLGAVILGLFFVLAVIRFVFRPVVSPLSRIARFGGSLRQQNRWRRF